MVANSSLKEFLNVDPEMLTEVAGVVPELTSETPRVQVASRNPADKLIKLGQRLDSLKKLMKAAETKFDDYARKGLQALKEAFPIQKTSIQKVVLPKALVKHYGGDLDKLKFGAQTITSDEHYEQLKRHVQLAKKYLGEDIHLHRITYKNGRPPVAVVMNVDAAEFNAVVTAERQKEHLEQTIAMTKQDMMKSAPGKAKENMASLEKASNLVSRAPIQSTPQISSPAMTGKAPGQGKGGPSRSV